MTRQLVAVCDDGLRRLHVGPTRDAVLAVREKLLSPLRVAVAGSVSSGKSTLVNALLGQNVAAVDAGECTRLVTWFTYDHHERVELRLRDGTSHSIAFGPGGRIPDDLGTPADAIARVVAYLSNERLRSITIIDTPGLNTVTEDNQRAAQDLLGVVDSSREADESRLAMSDADALLFLMPHVRSTDAEILERFRALFSSSGLSAVNAIGVLSKIDRLSPDGDPWPVARRLAQKARTDLASTVSDVVPVVGLLAETAATDRFTEDDAHALSVLAALDEIELEDALLSAQDLLDADMPDLDVRRRRRLLSMLDIYGIGIGVDLVRDGARGASALLAGFATRSGLDPISQIVDDTFARRADALKARAGLADLRRVASFAGSSDQAGVQAMAGPMERVELDPALHDLRVVDALRRVEDGSIDLPTGLGADLRRLALESSPARQLGLAEGADGSAIAVAASHAVRVWARYGNDVRRTPEERRLAADVREWYELVWDRASGPGTQAAAR